MMTVPAFRERIEAFLAKGEISPTRFGVVVANDPNFVRDLRSGRVPNLALAGKVMAFIEGEDRPPGRDDADCNGTHGGTATTAAPVGAAPASIEGAAA